MIGNNVKKLIENGWSLEVYNNSGGETFVIQGEIMKNPKRYRGRTFIDLTNRYDYFYKKDKFVHLSTYHKDPTKAFRQLEKKAAAYV